jgi:voltage-gated potassium channel
MPRLKRIIEESDTTAGKVFDLFIQSLIIISLLSYAFDTLPNLSDNSQKLLRGLELLCVGVFTVEYIARVIVATRKKDFIFSFFGVIDLVAILPFYLYIGVDLVSLRALRLLRLIRIFKLARYSNAVQRFHRAFLIAREELLLFLFITLIIMYLASVGIYQFEHVAQPKTFSSVFASLWWAVATLTTVGYGDVYPVTVGGKIFTFVILLVGLGIVSIPAGMVATALSKAREIED